jgi:small subunit ribosomal protein S1
MNNIDDFDWDKFESQKFGGAYSKDERAQLEQMYSETLNTVQEEEVIKGTIVGITDRDVILNIGLNQMVWCLFRNSAISRILKSVMK